MKYKNESDNLIQSDLEELRKEEPPKSAEGLYFNMLYITNDFHVPEIDGEFKALILDFCLPTSTYATMLLREVFKDDTSASNQIKLSIESAATGSNEKRKTEEPCVDEENAIKRIKMEDEGNGKGDVSE